MNQLAAVDLFPGSLTAMLCLQNHVHDFIFLVRKARGAVATESVANKLARACI